MPKVKKTTKIGRTIFDTKVKIDKVEQLHPENSPNVIYVVFDDMGFSHLGCYGSNINTPNIDNLATDGLRYNNFHTTAICSATRASLLTGANHHAVGVAHLVEMINGADNSQGHIDNSYGTVAEILKEYDYATFCTGKWHLSADQKSAGPYDQWPLAKGFDRYYGFLPSHDDQYRPRLTRDNSEVDYPKSVEEGYHFEEDVIDNAIDLVFNHTMAYPEQPFFLYLTFGAMHAPHQAPKEYIDRYKGKFDKGWDKIREEWFQNQKKLGIIPQNAELTDRNECIPAWDSLNDKQKAVYARHMEVFAGFLEYTDEQLGRLIQYLKDSNQYDNTVIVLISDNGTSAEGGINGRFNGWSGINITQNEQLELDFAYEHLDEIGTDKSFPHYPAGWANAGNTPFQWYKTWTHEGGVRDPLIISYPNGIKDKGGIRSQYHHVSDITPTILDIIGVDKPEFIKGVPQKPFTGTSLKYTFDNPDAPDEKTVQYYEMMGNRSIYKDGWKANVNHAFNDSYEDDVWELYNVAEDFTEKYNVADKYPEKLRELQEEFYIEAGRNNVFPLMRGGIHGTKHSVSRIYGNKMNIPEKEFVFKNVIKPYDLLNSQSVVSDKYFIEAEIDRADENAEGVLYCNGSRFGGVSLYIKDNKLKLAYNANSYYIFTAVSNVDVPVGKSTVRFDYEKTGENSAKVNLYINKEKTAVLDVSHLAYTSSTDTTIKADKHTSVTDDYEVPFEFTGKLNKLIIHQYATVLDYTEEVAKISAVE